MNEVAARVVAGMVVALTLTIIVTGQSWLMVVLAYGFLARVATGPTLSPMGQLATRFLAPRIATRRLVPGPPKRFAQTVGLVFSTTALVLHYGAGLTLAAHGVLAVLTVFASLEAFVGFCGGGGGVLRLQQPDALGADSTVGLRGVHEAGGQGELRLRARAVEG